jgi:hypothetical protein
LSSLWDFAVASAVAKVEARQAAQRVENTIRVRRERTGW